MINWPSNLIEELAYRRCIIFVGSGISATAKNDSMESPKIWNDFLKDAKSIMSNPDSADVGFIDQMLDEKNYLMALEAIYAECDPGNYSDFLKRNFARGNFKASNIHQYIKEIDAKIVITTNFDKIYESICNDYNYVVCDHTDTKKIISNIKSPENLIIKAHGTIDDVDNIVFTGEQYYNSKRKYPEFYKLMQALFLTNTVVFLGYSLSDPDINLLLENIANSSSNSCPHYIIIKEGTSKQIKNHWKKTYNISCLEYEGPGHSKLEEEIYILKEEVLALREERRMP